MKEAKHYEVSFALAISRLIKPRPILPDYMEFADFDLNEEEIRLDLQQLNLPFYPLNSMLPPIENYNHAYEHQRVLVYDLVCATVGLAVPAD